MSNWPPIPSCSRVRPCRVLPKDTNRILVGDEIMQFATASYLGDGLWQLTGLLRGRGGTEAAARNGHDTGAPVVLLDEKPVLLDTSNSTIAATQAIAAIGLADDTPVISQIGNAGATVRPLTPVHPHIEQYADGSWRISWVRRARGAWAWLDAGEIPLNGQSERYLVGVGDSETPSLRWEVAEPSLDLPPDIVSLLRSGHTGQTLWVKQVGDSALSAPLLLHIFD